MRFKPTILPLVHYQVAAGGADPTAAPECANRHEKTSLALPYPMRKDSLAEPSKAVAQGAIPRGVGSNPTAVIFFVLSLTWRAEISIGNFILQQHRKALRRLGHDNCRWCA
jgi:hypothetical protein